MLYFSIPALDPKVNVFGTNGRFLTRTVKNGRIAAVFIEPSLNIYCAQYLFDMLLLQLFQFKKSLIFIL